MSAQTQLHTRRVLELLSHVGQVVSSSKSLETVLDATVNLIKTMLDVERCSILILDPVEGVLHLKAASSIPHEEWSQVRVNLGDGISGRVASTGKPILVHDINNSEFASSENISRYSTNSFMSLPLIVKGRTIGVINVNNRTDAHRFERDDLDLMTALAGIIALNIENSRLFSASENLRSHLENVVESLHMAVLTMNVRGEVMHMNSRLVRLLSLDEASAVEGKPINQFVPAPILEVIDQLLPETIQYGVDTVGETEVTTVTQGKIPVEVHLASLNDASGNIDGVLVTIIDISMRREVAELRRLDELKSNFMSMVSHELRTPLTAIKGAVHLLANSMGGGLSESQNGLINIVSNNTERLTRLVNDLLDMVHIENHTLSVSPRPTDLAEVGRQVLEAFTLPARMKNISLTDNLENAEVWGDSERLTQAIAQLLDNAIKFTPKGGTVSISTGTRDSVGFVTIKDSGSGISPIVRPRLFSKFFQAENPMTRTAGGTGIGLYMAKSIAELHGGRVFAGNTEGRGAEFTVEIPLRSAVQAEA